MKINLTYIFHWLLIFGLILTSSKSSNIANSDITLVTLFLVSCLIFRYNKLKPDKGILIFTYIYISLTAFYLFQFGWINFTATTRTYIKIMYGYLTIKIVGPYFFNYFEDVVYKLSIISLPLFIIQYFMPLEMYKWNSFLEPVVSAPIFMDMKASSNSILFTVNASAFNRNAGFMWEPGGFGAILSLAMAFNLILNQFNILNRRFILLFICLITTYSTTAYINMLFIGLFFLVNSNKKYHFLLIPALISLSFLVYNLNNGYNKVDEAFTLRNEHIQYDYLYAKNLDFISIGRFGSFIVDFNDVQKKPFLGYGLQFTERTQSQFISIVRANGLSDYMATFGFIGILFLIINLKKTINSLKSIIPFKGAWILVFSILLSSFSNPVLLLPLFLSFQSYHVAVKQFIPDADKINDDEAVVIPV